MPSLTSKMVDFLMHSIGCGCGKTTTGNTNIAMLYPKDPHSTIICAQTGCGKIIFILDLLSFRCSYHGIFQHIVILCPTIRFNKTYQNCSWVWTDPEIFIVDACEQLHDYLQAFYKLFAGELTHTLSMIVPQITLSPRKKIHFPNSPFVTATQSKAFGYLLKSILQC